MCRSFYCINHRLDRTSTGVEVLRGEEEYVPAARLGDDHRGTAVSGSANAGGLVVAVIGVEGRGQLGLAGLPLRALPDGD